MNFLTACVTAALQQQVGSNSGKTRPGTKFYGYVVDDLMNNENVTAKERNQRCEVKTKINKVFVQGKSTVKLPSNVAPTVENLSQKVRERLES